MDIQHYKKVLITGNAGSGKTTMGIRVSEALGSEPVGLDRIVWQEGWKKTPAEEKSKRIASLVEATDRWVIEGVSHQVFDSADTVIFMDLPLHRCMFNVVKRSIQNGPQTRPELPENCPEWIGVWKALKICILYQLRTRPGILSKIEGARRKRVIRVCSFSEADVVLERLAGGDIVD